MKHRPSKFIRIERQFTRYLREPDKNPPPAGVAAERMQLYRELIHNNIERFIANNFPVLRRITPDARWHAMVQDYVARHRARTPLFPRLGEEFLHYLQNECDIREDPPFIVELAHYEWVETALALDTCEIDLEGIDPAGDLLAGIPVLSPLAWPLAYWFPVHRITPDFQPMTPGVQPTYLVVYRDREDKVKFMEANPITARLLEWLVRETGRTGRELLELIAQELNYPNLSAVIGGGHEIMEKLQRRGVLLGIRSKITPHAY